MGRTGHPGIGFEWHGEDVRFHHQVGMAWIKCDQRRGPHLCSPDLRALLERLASDGANSSHRPARDTGPQLGIVGCGDTTWAAIGRAQPPGGSAGKVESWGAGVARPIVVILIL
jgi:hypothetical protein